MKRSLLLFLLLAFFSSLFSQIVFEKGYLINNTGRIIECYIKNSDWINNPDRFQYKVKESDNPETGMIDSVKEFGIYGAATYVRSNVLIDQSSSDINNLNEDRNPIWLRKTVYLKVIIRSKATLYYYESNNLKRFFYSLSDTSVKQLVYKTYLIGSSIVNNIAFHQQLFENVRCGDMNTTSVANLNYNMKELKNYFIEYNTCMGDSIIVYKNVTKRKKFNIKLSTGFNISSLTLSNSYLIDEIAFNTRFTCVLGAEAEYILPFNKNKWGVIINPTFQYFHGNKSLDQGTASIKLNSIELPVGIRYYAYLNSQSKLFFEGLFVSNFEMNIGSEGNFRGTSLDVLSRNSGAIGAGFEHNKISFEVRYYSAREILSDYIWWASEYKRISFIIGYKILQK